MSQLQSATLDLEVRMPVAPRYADILSPDALKFVERLVREFGQRREELLRAGPSGNESSTPASVLIFSPPAHLSAKLSGQSRRFRVISKIGAWRSPARRTGK